jgi:peptide/nickel transport system substrate-binding protein
LGSGPYRLTDPESWRPDEGRVELVRNQRYWGSVQPPYNRIVWSVIENDSARLAAFRNGSVDSYSSKPREYKKLLADAQISQKTEHHEYMSPTAGYSYIGWNSERDGLPTRFADGRVRLAMTLLTDRQRIVDELMLGYAEIAVSPFNPRSPQHNPQLQPRTPDLDKAKDLLTQAGYADRDGDGVLENEAGEPFEFELVYFQDSDDTRRIVLFLKDLYARAGVLLVPKPTEWSVMIDLLNNRNFDAITLGWSSGVETDIFQMFHGSQTEGGGDNFVNFRNAELDRLIDEARSTVDEAARMQLWWQAEAILHAEQPYTFLMRRKTLQFIDKRIQNVAETKLGLNLVHVPVVTYVPSALQKYQQ